MRVQILLFAGAKQLAGRGQVEVDLAPAARVCDARQALLEAVPELSPLARALAFAVDHEYVRDDHPLAEGDELACIPPVSGG